MCQKMDSCSPEVECRYKCGYMCRNRNAEKVHASRKHRGEPPPPEYLPNNRVPTADKDVECRYKCGFFCKTIKAERTHASRMHRGDKLAQRRYNTWCMEENCDTSVGLGGLSLYCQAD